MICVAPAVLPFSDVGAAFEDPVAYQAAVALVQNLFAIFALHRVIAPAAAHVVWFAAIVAPFPDL